MLNWTSDNAAVQPLPEAKTKGKHSMLPVLIVLFLVSYGLLSVLVVEQGRTIENQRYLIMSLFDDSNQLSQMKGKAFQKQRAEAQAQASTKDHSQAQTPSTQATPGDHAKSSQGAGKLRKPLQKPPVGADDNGDARRTVLKI